MNRRTNERRGVTLLELLAVVTLLGIFASITMMRFGRSIFADFGARGETRAISLALLEAQRGAIKTGDNHYVQFDATNAKSFSVLRVMDTGDRLVDGPHALAADTVVTVSTTRMEFTFEGQALGDYNITLDGENWIWQLNVIQINGSLQTVSQAKS